MRARSPLLPVFLIVLVDIFGLTLVLPLLAIYAERFGATPFQATLLVSVFAAFQLISGPILGAVSDRIGRKPMLLLSQAGSLVGFVILAKADALWMVFLGRIIDGATAGNLSLAQAYIADHTAPEKRAKAFALIGIAFGLGFFVGPFVTSALVVHGMEAPIWAAAGLSSLSILTTALLLPGGAPPAAPSDGAGLPGGKRPSVLAFSTYAGFFSRPVLGGLLLQFFIFSFAFATFTSGFALFAERSFRYEDHAFGVKEIGYTFMYVGFLGILLQGGIVGRLVKRYGEGPLVAVGFVATTVSYALLGQIGTIPALLGTATISSFGNALLRPCLSALISKNAARHETGTAIGISQSLGSLATIVAPALGGALITAGHLSWWASVAALISAAGFLVRGLGSARVAVATPS
ncbi:MAG: MFS transporter [Myxococcota bacterium]